MTALHRSPVSHGPLTGSRVPRPLTRLIVRSVPPLMVRATRSATRTSPRSRSSRKSTGRSRQPTHPSWTEMITECIVTTPDGTQNGVSRPTLKKAPLYFSVRRFSY
ncbi:hypothetical protein EDD15DRAFT_698432 [Pisolithus albus]|nr:hypothetical protein EDD15DRAFT_698432 [Pisolithus albus]